MLKLYIYNNENLCFEQIKIKHYILSIFIVFCIGMSLGLSPRVVHTIERIPFRIQEEENTFHPDKLKGMIKEMNFEHKDIVYAQCILESGNFTSPVFKHNNNIIGMKKSTSRVTTHKGSQLNHAFYSNWQSSLIDYGIWQSTYARNLTREQYLMLLDKIYAKDEQYSKKLLKIIKDYNL